MTVTTLTVPSDSEIAARDYIDTLHESLFRVQDAVAELDRAIAALHALRPLTAADAVGRAKSLIRFALSAVDVESVNRSHIGTRPTCPVCYDRRTIYPDGDPAGDREDCPACTTGAPR